MEVKYLFYKEYLKNRNVSDYEILITKTNNSYLIGPIINEQFLEDSFYRRLVSSSIYEIKSYKNISKKKLYKLLSYANELHNNQVIEIFKDGKNVIHTITLVPGGKYEE